MHGYKDRVNVVKYSESKEKRTVTKVPVDLDEMARRALRTSKMVVNEANMELARKQLLESNPKKEYFDTQETISTRTISVFGGVDMNFDCGYVTQKPAKQNEAEYDSDDSCESNSTQSSRHPAEEEANRLPFVLKREANCEECGQQLSVEELNNVEDTRATRDLCRLHASNTCCYCQKFVISGCVVKGQKEVYDVPSMIG